MSDSLVAAFIAFVVAVAGFTGLCIVAPTGGPIDAMYEGELIKDIEFSGEISHEMETVQVQLVYRNPTDHVVSFILRYPVVFERFVDGVKVENGGWGGEGESIGVSVAPGDEYIVCDASFYAEDVGWNEIEWEGVRKGVSVEKSGVVMRVVTDKDRYYRGEGGDAVFEFYNPTGHNITITPPSQIETYIIFTDGSRSGGTVMFIDWVWGNYQLAPKESHRIYGFHFTTYDLGKMTLVVNGYSKTVEVVPR